MKIGDRVRATMDGSQWFTGVLAAGSEIFAQYGVVRDDIKELRFFIHAEPHEHCCCNACKNGTAHASDCAVHNMPYRKNEICDCGKSN